MIESWRWFGPDDPVTLANVAQAGASGVVTALHDIPTGEVWPLEQILARREAIEAAGLSWVVIESIPVHTDIKTRSGDFERYIENYRQSLRNVGAAGVETVCYNFMPVIDWTRTNLRKQLATTAVALSFDMADMAAYDVFMLRRDGSERDYPADVVARAASIYENMDEAARAQLERNILAGLPGGDGSYDREGFREALAEFDTVDSERMRKNLFAFLEAVVPVAEEAGVRLCIHPDDPPFSLFGLPRVMSTADDARAMLAAVPSPSNGLTLCAGSFGARCDNDLTRMAAEFHERIFFVHLRNVRRQDDGSFFESDHLDGDNDMLGLIAELMDEEARRRLADSGLGEIPMRPDHGHLIGEEIDSDEARPGYSFAGRVKGLAELRGVIYALERLRAAN